MATTPEQVEDYFKQLEWPFIRKEGNLWDSGYNGNNFRFRFFVRLTENWLYVTWLFPVAIHDDCRASGLKVRQATVPPGFSGTERYLPAGFSTSSRVSARMKLSK